MRPLRLPLAVVLAVIVSLFSSTVAAVAQQATATVTVLHALPGFTADVYVNGELTLSGFEPETATDPLELPAGRYTIEIRDVGADPSSPPALEGTVRLRAGQNLSIIAGLTPAGEPELNVFTNAVERVPPGRTQLVVRNVADLLTVGVSLDGRDLFARVPHGGEKQAQVEAGGPFELEALAEGQTAIGPQELELEEGTVGIVYAVGSSESGTLGFMFQTIQGLESAPASVLTGTGGLLAQDAIPAWAVAAMVMGVVGLAAAAVMASRGREDHRATSR